MPVDELVTRLGNLLGREYRWPNSPGRDQAVEVVNIVMAAVKAYVRGGPNWTPNDEQSSVILCAAGRLIAHPRQIDMSEAVGPQSASWRGGFQGFTLGERIILDRYRVTAK